MTVRMKRLPENAKTHNLKDGTVAHTIEADGFQKLIAYHTPNGSWVHQDYRDKPKKNRKKGKKKG